MRNWHDHEVPDNLVEKLKEIMNGVHSHETLVVKELSSHSYAYVVFYADDSYKRVIFSSPSICKNISGNIYEDTEVCLDTEVGWDMVKSFLLQNY